MRITPEMLNARIESQISELAGNHPNSECASCSHCKAIAAVRESPAAISLVSRLIQNYKRTKDIGVFAHAYAIGLADGAILAESVKLEEMSL